MTCPACGGVIDLRDLAIVMAHLAPLPHPGQDQTNWGMLERGLGSGPPCGSRPA
jgi:hypothetical protein